MSAKRNEPSVVRSAMGGAVTGLLLAGLVSRYLLAFSAPPSGIEADAFASILERPAVSGELLALEAPASEPSYASNR